MASPASPCRLTVILKSDFATLAACKCVSPRILYYRQRRAVARVFPSGEVVYRTGPEWYTPLPKARRLVDWQEEPRNGKATSANIEHKSQKEELSELRLGDVVYLDGTIYTAREGVYKRALEDKANLPVDLPHRSANFHCSPAATMQLSWQF